MEEIVRKELQKTGKRFWMNYSSGYLMAHFVGPKVSRPDLLWDERDGFLVVSNGTRQAVFYEGMSAKYAAIMLFKAAFHSKKPVKFY